MVGVTNKGGKAMREDEMQVLGAPRKKIYHVWGFAAVACLLVMAGLVFLFTKNDVSQNRSIGPALKGTTVDPALQVVADSLLSDMLTLINGLQGQVIVMEVESGAIKAMVGKERRFDGTYQWCDNFAYQQELGSLGKTASLLAALETGEVKLKDTVDAKTGTVEVSEGLFLKDHNWRRGGYGKLSVAQAMEVSSNIGIALAVKKAFMGREQLFFDQLDKMSYGQPDTIRGIVGLRPTVFTTPESPEWENWQLLWNAIGYMRKIAPIQMLTFYNAIANDGKMVRPTLYEGNVDVINGQIASKKNIVEMQRVLRSVVENGLGHKAGSEKTSVAGKTGTSQVDVVYSEGDHDVYEYNLSFCGYFPADHPKYSIIVSLNKLGLPASGGGMAGPVFKGIVEWMVDHE